MRKLRALLQTTAISGLLGFSLGGCPADVGDQLSDLAEGLLDLTQEEVVDLLDSFVNDGETPDVEVVDIEEVPVFNAQTFDNFAGDYNDVETSEEDFLAQIGEPQQRPGDAPRDVVLAMGRLAGRYVTDEPGAGSDTSGGEFEGRWFARGGEQTGFVTGRFEPLPREELPPNFAGGGVFEGHYLSEDGEFRGYLRGTYGRARNGAGRFVGNWHDDEMQLIGTLSGSWRDRAEGGGGGFGGHWAAFDVCDEAGTLDDGDDLPGDLPSQPRQPTPADDAAAIEQIEDDLEQLDDAVLEDFFSDVEGELDETEAENEIDLLEDTSYCVDGAGLLRGWHRRGLPRDLDPNVDADGAWRAGWRSASGEHRGTINGLWKLRRGHGDDSDDDFGDPNDFDPNDLDPNDFDDMDDMEDEDDRRPGVKGYLAGRVFNEDGEQIGTIRGKFGIGRRGVGVFAGRYFNLDNELEGALRGRWDKSRGRRGGPLFGAWIHLDDETEPGDDVGDGVTVNEDGTPAG